MGGKEEVGSKRGEGKRNRNVVKEQREKHKDNEDKLKSSCVILGKFQRTLDRQSL